MKSKVNLQLFASTGSRTTSGSSSHSETSSSSQTQGGSHTEGSSHSQTDSTSKTTNHQEGGAHSDSSGKSWASGQVEDKTQQMRDKYNSEYNSDAKVQDAYQRLQDTLDKKPGFQSQYEDKLNQLYEQILNRDKFSYDFNADSMYQMYKDQYTQAGKSAMQDTMANQAALSGGYSSSYAQTAGQQSYQNYMQQLNTEILPTLRNQAYQEYTDEQNRMLQNYQLTSDAYNREYGQYRDSVADWQSDRAFNQSNYQDERNFDYNQFANERNYWNSEYWNEKNAEQSNSSSSDQTNWSDSVSKTKAQSITDEKNVSDSSFWQNTNSSSVSDSSSSSWSETTPTGATSSSSSGKMSARSASVPTIQDEVPKVSGWYDSIDERKAQSANQEGAILSNVANYEKGYENPYNTVDRWNNNGYDTSNVQLDENSSPAQIVRASMPQNSVARNFNDDQINTLIDQLYSAYDDGQLGKITKEMQNTLGWDKASIDILVEEAKRRRNQVFTKY